MPLRLGRCRNRNRVDGPRADVLVPCVAVEVFQTLDGIVGPGYVANRNPTDSGLLLPDLNLLSDYDNDNDNDNDNACIHCFTYF